MATYLTPGVYIEKQNAFPNSVAAVPTAVSAFVGYTEKALSNIQSLKNIPTRITSLAEYHQFFGKGPDIKYKVKNDSVIGVVLEEIHETKYYLYNSLRLFFANGGSACYIISVGSYSDKIQKDELTEGIRILQKEPEPTLLVIPDTAGLDEEDCYSVQVNMLRRCGSDAKSRFALLDVFDGYKIQASSKEDDVIIKFREGIGMNFLQWGAAYYPWLNTTVVQESEINFKKNISNLDGLEQLLCDDINTLLVEKGIDKKTADQIKTQIALLSVYDVNVETLHQTLLAVSPMYKTIMGEIRSLMNILPPSAGMAGVISMVDNAVGVWKSPANVSINSVISPTVNITHAMQEDLNLPLDGKAINAIRSFPGQGVLVWGARTLDGNSQDWRYINVRRTATMIEQSLKNVAEAFAFQPNVVKTWITVKGMMTNFLTDQWKKGALAGAAPEDAFSVDIGLGVTMTPSDILDGIMNISIKVALVRPAEFIVITLQQHMQKS